MMWRETREAPNGFVLENEPIWRRILVGFGCRDNYFAASRRTRFGKRTHFEGVFEGVLAVGMVFYVRFRGCAAHTYGRPPRQWAAYKARRLGFCASQKRSLYLAHMGP